VVYNIVSLRNSTRWQVEAAAGDKEGDFTFGISGYVAIILSEFQISVNTPTTKHVLTQ
jgi:hypothetical protein